MPITLRNVLTPTFNELLRRALDENLAMKLLVLVPKSDDSVVYITDSLLCNRWASNVSAGISQKVILGLDL